MAGLVESGTLVDLIIALVIGEAALLALLRRATGRGPGLAPLAATLASGLCLMLALRAALAGAPWPWVAAALAASGIAHATDLVRRL